MSLCRWYWWKYSLFDREIINISKVLVKLKEMLPSSPTLVILLRREVSIGRFLEMGTVFQPSSWGGPPRPGVWGPPRPPMPPPPILPPGPPPISFLETRACCTFICSLCSSSSASLWIWSMVLGPWSPRRGTQLFWNSSREKVSTEQKLKMNNQNSWLVYFSLFKIQSQVPEVW